MKNELCHDCLCSRWPSGVNVAVTEKLCRQTPRLAACARSLYLFAPSVIGQEDSVFLSVVPPHTDHHLEMIKNRFF